MTTYSDSVQYLYSLGNEIKTIKLGLGRISAILAALDHPERAYRSIHVAGTNGKGSTCAMIESALRVSGQKTGLYTSPHLVQPTERIRIAGQEVTEEQFAAAFERVQRTAVDLVDSGGIDGPPTYFETVTAMAFLLFREHQVAAAVVEVGLGGRLDATNVITPESCVITPVDFDHENWLGSTLRAIAGEKAGILKPGVPAVVANQPAEARERILEQAREVGAPVIETSSWKVEDSELSRYGCRFRARRGESSIEVECNLAGEHQIENALTAAVTLHQAGLEPTAIAEGIRRARWPGRLERVAARPDIILDGAHNPAAVSALVAYIRRFFGDRKVWLIYATMRDKSIGEIGDQLSGLAGEIILTQVDSPRALRPEALRPLFDHPRVRTARRLADALALAREAAPEDVIFVTGSLYLVGEARALLVK